MTFSKLAAFSKSPISYMLISLLLLLPSAAFACSGIKSQSLTVGSTTLENTDIPLLSFTPRKSNRKLTIVGNANTVQVSFDNQCASFNLRDYHGIHVQLLNSGEEYDGGRLDVFQQVRGGNGDDVIRTGDDVDYIYAGAGNDKVYSNGNRDKVDAGAGMDCVEAGSNGTQYSEQISNEELASCGQHTKLVAKLESCSESGTGNRALLNYYQSGTVWGLDSSLSNNKIRVEQIEKYLFATVNNYNDKLCVSSSTDKVDLIFAKLSNNNDYFEGSGVDVNMTVYGYEGNDTITTGDGNDWIIGGSGSDTIKGRGGIDWIIGDTRVETEYAGVAWRMDDSGRDGKDKLYGDDGDDVIFGNGSNDNIYGGNGGDLIFGNSGSTDKLYGNSGNDLIIASGGKKWSKRAKMWGGDGYDIEICEKGECYMSGGNKNDFLVFLPNNRDVEYSGGDGADILYNRGDDFPKGTGGSGNDFVMCKNCRATVNGVRYVMDSDLDRAMGQANRRLASSFKSTIRLSKNLNDNKDKLRSRAAALVDNQAFRYWLNNRSKNIHTVQSKK